jgi:hypothetical protein
VKKLTNGDLAALLGNRAAASQNVCTSAILREVGNRRLTELAGLVSSYLNYEYVRTTPGGKIRIVGSSADPYPAMGVLYGFGQPAVPFVKEALKRQDADELTRRNAAKTMLLIFRDDIVAGARELGAAYWSTQDVGVAAKVMQGAIAAASMSRPAYSAGARQRVASRTSLP